MMRKTEKKLEKKRKNEGGSKWEKIGWDEDKKICPFDDKKVCPVTSAFCHTHAKSVFEKANKYKRPCREICEVFFLHRKTLRAFYIATWNFYVIQKK